MENVEREGKARYDSGELSYVADEDNIVLREPRDLFSIIYTSGSTGQPKGALSSLFFQGRMEVTFKPQRRDAQRWRLETWNRISQWYFPPATH